MFRIIFLLLIVITGVTGGCAGHRAKPETMASAAPAYHYLLSQLEVLNNRPEEALHSLDQALPQDPDNPYLWYKRAALEAALGDLKRAEEDCRKSLALSPAGSEDFDTLFLLGKLLQTQERRSEAAGVYLKALEKQPDSAEARYLLVETYVAEKNYPEVTRQIAVWKKNAPGDTVPFFYEASFYQNVLKSPVRAIATYRQVLKLEPENSRALTALGELYLSQKNDRAALAVFHQLEALDPADLSVPLKIALIYYESKRTDQAIAQFKEILKSHPDSDRVLYYLGVIYENVKRDSEALDQFEKIPDSSDHYRDARLHIAFIHHRQKEDEKAFEKLHEAIAKKPEIGAFYEYLAELNRGQGQYEEGIHVLKEGIEKSPEKESLYYSLGTLYDRTGHFQESMEAMRKVLEINPDNANALNYIGYSYADRGERLDEALLMIQKALLLKPEDGYITDSLGWVYYRKGDIDQAILYCSKAYQAVPKEPTIAEHLGDIFLKREEKDKALRYFQESMMQLQKESEDHTKEIERLKAKIEFLQKPPAR